MILNIKGNIVSDDIKRMVNALRDWGFTVLSDYFAPMDAKQALEELPAGDRLEVKINSGGGDVYAGQEIYNIFRERNDVDIEVESLAASAASVIAMAGPSKISPVGMVMIHDVSVSCAGGNHADLEKMADTLKAFDEALSTAYVEKTGKSKEEILNLMDNETWLTANKAVELGFIDEISRPAAEGMTMTNSFSCSDFSDIEKMFREAKASKDAEKEQLATAKAELLSDLDSFGE